MILIKYKSEFFWILYIAYIAYGYIELYMKIYTSCYKIDRDPRKVPGYIQLLGQ
jgi:hypothetical protein